MTTKNGQTKKRQAKGRHTETAGERTVRFQAQAAINSEVFVAGTFNDWNPATHRLEPNGNGMYAAQLAIPPGRHEYKFVIDGKWQVDDSNPAWSPNGLGSLNSVLDVSEEAPPTAEARA